MFETIKEAQSFFLRFCGLYLKADSLERGREVGQLCQRLRPLQKRRPALTTQRPFIAPNPNRVRYECGPVSARLPHGLQFTPTAACHNVARNLL